MDQKPLTSSNYLYNIDRIMQEVSDAILSEKEQRCIGENIQLPNFENCVIHNVDDGLNSRQLAQYRKQFLSLNKLKPIDGSKDEIAEAFVQFINSSMHQYVPGLFNQIS